MRTLHEDRTTFLIVCRRILLRMRNASDKRCTESEKNIFCLINFVPKIVPLMRLGGKVW